jgi:prepilin-type N-terminal cleavage/methylation domain-containing protein
MKIPLASNFQKMPARCESGDVAIGHSPIGSGSMASPSPGGEGRGEGELNSNSPFFTLHSSFRQRGEGKQNSKFKIHHSSLRKQAFTMMEIAISLAIIGIALVAIIGVLPIGMNVQQQNRQQTIIGGDASLLMEDIRNGLLGANDLTNYIYAITNYWAYYQPNGTTNQVGVNSYTFSSASVASGYPLTGGSPLTNGANIIGLLSTPEFIGASGDIGGDVPGQPIPSLLYGGISNHIVAYVYSISGLAVEKPPQDNPIVSQGTFGYRLYVVNAPTPVPTNVFFFWPRWTSGSYSAPAEVFYDWTYWNYPTNLNPNIAVPPTTQVPGNPPFGVLPDWQMTPNYNLQLALNLHELRLTFLWPQQPSGKLGPGLQTFRTLVAGRLMEQPSLTNAVFFNTNFYVYQSQSFTNTP